MRQDEQTYRRATNAALLGFFAQAILLVVMLLTAFWAASKEMVGESKTLFAISYHMIGGIFVWVILWMVYNQHRLERLESIETQQLSEDDASMAALFDEHADELQLSRKRLRNLYKYGINGVSLLVAAYMLIAGFTMSWNAWNYMNYPPMWTPKEISVQNSTTLLVLTIVVAFVAFVSARYIAGMTKVKEWQMLRGGAGYLMAAALASIIAFVASLVGSLGEPSMWSYLIFIYSLMLIVMGVEIVLSFLFGAYRPRKPGEVPKPPFESRLLAWLTSPESIAKIINETINYQFGFEVSKSWFYQLLGRSITPLIVFGGLTLVGLSSIVVVSPHEQAIITRFGEMKGEPLGPGMHFKLPWPFGEARKYPVKRIHQLVVGSSTEMPEEGKAILWTNQHAGQEDYLITAPTPYEGRGNETDPDAAGPAGMSLTGAQIIIQYRVRNLMDLVNHAPYPYLMLTAEHPELRRLAGQMLSSIAERRVNQYFATHTIDELLGYGAVKASEVLQKQIQADFDDNKLGLEVLLVSMSGVHPPQESVAPSFLEQIGVRQERQTTIENAKAEEIETLARVAGSRDMARKIYDAIESLERIKDEIADLSSDEQDKIEAKIKLRIAQEVEVERLLTQSRGEAAQIIQEARADRWSQALGERAQAIIFEAEMKAYKNAPEVYVMRRYLETREEALRDARKIVIGKTSEGEAVIRLDLKDPTSQLGDILEQD